MIQHSHYQFKPSRYLILVLSLYYGSVGVLIGWVSVPLMLLTLLLALLDGYRLIRRYAVLTAAHAICQGIYLSSGYWRIRYVDGTNALVEINAVRRLPGLVQCELTHVLDGRRQPWFVARDMLCPAAFHRFYLQILVPSKPR